MFRLFVVLSVILGLAGVSVDSFFNDLVSSGLAKALESEPSLGVVDEHPFISLAILLPWLVAALAGVVGIFLFKRWGRTLSLYSTVFGFFITPFLGSFAGSGLSSALDEASFTLWGAALAMSYFSSVSEHFEIKNR
jgi:hypothetical protein